ncbi:hypothetical protein OH492_09185 [Vibrio chagasii]|nr:hypothetical protein [Vibrio chagasii]
MMYRCTDGSLNIVEPSLADLVAGTPTTPTIDVPTQSTLMKARSPNLFDNWYCCHLGPECIDKSRCLP